MTVKIRRGGQGPNKGILKKNKEANVVLSQEEFEARYQVAD